MKKKLILPWTITEKNTFAPSAGLKKFFKNSFEDKNMSLCLFFFFFKNRSTLLVSRHVLSHC